MDGVGGMVWRGGGDGYSYPGSSDAIIARDFENAMDRSGLMLGSGDDGGHLVVIIVCSLLFRRVTRGGTGGGGGDI